MTVSFRVQIGESLWIKQGSTTDRIDRDVFRSTSEDGDGVLPKYSVTLRGNSEPNLGNNKVTRLVPTRIGKDPSFIYNGLTLEILSSVHPYYVNVGNLKLVLRSRLRNPNCPPSKPRHDTLRPDLGSETPGHSRKSKVHVLQLLGTFGTTTVVYLLWFTVPSCRPINPQLPTLNLSPFSELQLGISPTLTKDICTNTCLESKRPQQREIVESALYICLIFLWSLRIKSK